MAEGYQHQADNIGGRRGGSSSGNATGKRLLSTLLTEMDGLEQAKGILVLAATNRPHAIDPALMCFGRFDLALHVPPPDLEARYEILCVHTTNMKLGDDVALKSIVEDTELFTGAELEGLCREAGIVALREDISATTVWDRHLQLAKGSLKPTLTAEMVDHMPSSQSIRRFVPRFDPQPATYHTRGELRKNDLDRWVVSGLG